MVALSVGEAEYMELARTGQQAAWRKSISRKIGFTIHEPIPLYVDNQAVIFLTVIQLSNIELSILTYDIITYGNSMKI